MTAWDDYRRSMPQLDKQNCPRGDGGRLRSVGNYSRDRYNPGDTEPHWECSVCQRWWTVSELRRLPPETTP